MIIDIYGRGVITARHLISIRELTSQQIYNLIELGLELKEKHRSNLAYQPLLGKTVITSFPPTSLRTRVSFETGIFQLGAQALNLPLDFSGREPVEDKIGYLNNWIDYLVIRYPEQDIIEQIAELAEFKVINAMSKRVHPCEILGDLMSIYELRGNLTSLRFVFVGEGANICNSWFNAAAKLDLNLTQICPGGYAVAPEMLAYAQEHSKGEISVTQDIVVGLQNADVILTDAWPVSKSDNEEYSKFLPYQISLDKISIANEDCILNPCPPFTRGNEVTADVIASKHFIGYKAKENLLHMQKAILTSLE